LAREMAALHFMKDKLGKIDVFVRSHVHYFVHVEFTHTRSEEHTSELQSRENLVCRLLLEKKTELVRSDEADALLAGDAEAFMHPLILAFFCSLRALAPTDNDTLSLHDALPISLAREMAALHFMKDKLGKIDVFVRSHVHYFVHVEFTHT